MFGEYVRRYFVSYVGNGQELGSRFLGVFWGSRTSSAQKFYPLPYLWVGSNETPILDHYRMLYFKGA